MQDKSNTSDTFSARIEQLRLALGGSMVAVAEALGVSRTMLYDIKNGKVPVSDKMWRLLETAEGVLPTRSPKAPDDSTARLKAAAAMMRRQAVALLQGADELDPDTAGQAQAYLNDLTRRALAETTQSRTEERKRA